MKKVLLYSGGMDSFCLAQIAQPDVLVHVMMGTRYGHVETERLTVPKNVNAERILIELPLGIYERDDAIIPARNAFLVLMAAQYGDEILLGATAGDRSTDKDEKFAQIMSDLMTHIWQPQWWIPEGQEKKVSLPLKHMTKRQIVKAFIDANGDPNDLNFLTFSCYTPVGELECGKCKPCARKWIALAANNITPFVSAYDYVLETYYKEALSDNWDRGEQERQDVLDAVMFAKGE